MDLGFFQASWAGRGISYNDMAFMLIINFETSSWYSIWYVFEMRTKSPFDGYSSTREIVVAVDSTEWKLICHMSLC